MSRSAADDYRDKTAHEISALSQRLRRSGHPAPLGDPALGVAIVVEEPVGPRVLDALSRSLRTIKLPDAYVTYASTGSLLQEILSIEPRLLVAVGPGAAYAIDAAEHPLASESFSSAPEGVPFPWRSGTTGLRLPSLAPALKDREAKYRFWRAFLTLKDLTAEIQG